MINKAKNLKNQRQYESGLTLVEVSIGLVLLGLFMAFATHSYLLWREDFLQNKTNDTLRQANVAIAQFFRDNNRYPCPADPSLAPNDADYGVEDCSFSSLVRTTTTTATTVAGDIYTGAVPFVTLSALEDISLDAWKNKLSYSVSDVVIDPTTHPDPTVAALYPGAWSTNMLSAPPVGTRFPPWGNIQLDGFVMQENPPSSGAFVCTRTNQSAYLGNPTIQSNNAHYIIISHGSNGEGAFTRYGQIASACPAAGTRLDAENCDFGSTDFTFVSSGGCSAGSAQNASYYDDFTISIQSAPNSIWQNSRGVGAVNEAFTAVQRVGIGTADPLSELHVAGVIRAENSIPDPLIIPPIDDGDLITNMACRANPAYNPALPLSVANQPTLDCFRPEMIAGSGINCDGGGMRGIANGDAECGFAYTAVGAIACPTGQYLQGIDSTGAEICVTP